MYRLFSCFQPLLYGPYISKNILWQNYKAKYRAQKSDAQNKENDVVNSVKSIWYQKSRFISWLVTKYFFPSTAFCVTYYINIRRINSNVKNKNN